jgi:hypothetical protein
MDFLAAAKKGELVNKIEEDRKREESLERQRIIDDRKERLKKDHEESCRIREISRQQELKRLEYEEELRKKRHDEKQIPPNGCSIHSCRSKIYSFNHDNGTSYDADCEFKYSIGRTERVFKVYLVSQTRYLFGGRMKNFDKLILSLLNDYTNCNYDTSSCKFS